jgi:Rieske [2Fe-2S] domain
MHNSLARTQVARRLAISNPGRIPAARYYDADFFDAEAEHLWPHVWQMACRLEQIPDVGDWIEYQNLGKSVIVVNAGEGGIKAWHNACRHRGVPIAGNLTKDGLAGRNFGNCKALGFVCPSFAAFRRAPSPAFRLVTASRATPSMSPTGDA